MILIGSMTDLTRSSCPRTLATESRILGDVVLDALKMAATAAEGRIEGLTGPSDNRFTSIRYSERLSEFGAPLSVGQWATSMATPLADRVTGLYRTEPILGPH